MLWAAIFSGMFASQSERADTVTRALGRDGKPVRRWRFYIENINDGSHPLHHKCTLQLQPSGYKIFQQSWALDIWNFANLACCVKARQKTNWTIIIISHLRHVIKTHDPWWFQRLLMTANICKIFSIILTICGKFLWPTIWKSFCNSF